MNILFLMACPPYFKCTVVEFYCLTTIRILGEKHRVGVISFVESDGERARFFEWNLRICYGGAANSGFSSALVFAVAVSLNLYLSVRLR